MRRLPTRSGSRLRTLAPLAAGMAAVSLAAAGCGGEAQTTGASAASVAGFIPSSAPMYVEVSTELDGPQWRQLDTLARVFPAYPELRKDLDESLRTGDVNFETEVQPLLGGRAAVAALSLPSANPRTTPDSAVDDSSFIAVIDLADGKDAQAEALLAREADDAPATLDGVKVYKEDDTVAAVVEGNMLFANTEADLKTAIDAEKAGGDRVLANTDRFTEAIGKLPADTFAQVYVDYGALVRQQAATNEQLRQLGPLADLADARLAASMAAEPNGIRMKGVVLGAPETPGEFTPKLDDKVPADSIAYFGFANLQGQVGTAIEQLRATDPNIAQQLTAASAQIQPLLGVSLDDLRALTTKEHALVVTKGAPLPGAVLALEVEDGARSQRTLDTLRERVPAALRQFSPDTQIPAWRQVPLEGGVQGWDLPISPTGGVTYGVDGNLALVGSSPGAVRAIQRPVQPLSGLAEYTEATANMPENVTGVAWVNVTEALRLAEASGAYRDNPEALANARKVKSVVGWSTGGSEPTFEVFVRIGN